MENENRTTPAAVSALVVIGLLIALGAVAYVVYQKSQDTNQDTNDVDTGVEDIDDSTADDNDAESPTDDSDDVNSDMIRNVEVNGGTSTSTSLVTISSPVTVTGEAVGNWYFEATFPIQVLDASGNVLGSGTAQAQGDWMTTNFVPFTASIVFTAPTSDTTGKIILHKDNPSGLPQNEASIEIPISF